eukprot:g864.t1
MDEVRKHDTRKDCWVVIHGKVWDLTDFQQSHPGGAKIIRDNAGKDATAVFDETHPKDLAQRLLSPDLCVGIVDPTTISEEDRAKPQKYVEEGSNNSSGSTTWTKPQLGAMLNIYDFESVASREMSKEGWAYYSSGADDELTLRENHLAYQRIWLVPRILVDVAKVDMRTTMLGRSCSFPLYFTATALGKLAHPEGELAITRAAASSGVPYMLPTLSSFTLAEMLDARTEGQTQFGQLYVNSDRSRSKAYVEALQRGGCKGLFITVDAPQLGRREKDMRNKFRGQGTDVQKNDDGVNRNDGVTRAISSYIDPSLCWKDLAWFKSFTTMPIVLKGVQSAEDAVLAYRAGLAGVVLSNHGGRQLDTARSAIEILEDVVEALDSTDTTWRERFEVYVDGGIRRASDIFKAIALGAKAVGIGRPVLYSLASYGQAGVERMVRLLKEELTMVMRLMGTPTIESISRRHVATRSLKYHAGSFPRDNLMLDTYQPLQTQVSRL